MKVKSESEVTQLCPTLATTWTAAYQAPPSIGFSKQEYWSGVPLPSPSETARVALTVEPGVKDEDQWSNRQLFFIMKSSSTIQVFKTFLFLL